MSFGVVAGSARGKIQRPSKERRSVLIRCGGFVVRVWRCVWWDQCKDRLLRAGSVCSEVAVYVLCIAVWNIPCVCGGGGEWLAVCGVWRGVWRVLVSSGGGGGVVVVVCDWCGVSWVGLVWSGGGGGGVRRKPVAAKDTTCVVRL